MKKYLIVTALLLCALTSCVRKRVVLDMAGQCDSLSGVVSEKDSLISLVFEDIHAIAGNLAEIKMRENLITIPEDGEGGTRPIQQINSDIAAIDRLLEENRMKIASLQNAAGQLRKSNIKVGALEKIIVDMEDQLSKKTAEVEALRGELTEREREVEQLLGRLAEGEAVAAKLGEENTSLENRLNTVYYIVGAERELLDAQILSKEGFIGRTLTVNRNGAMDSFTQADARLLTEIPVGWKKTTVVTTHPRDSYELVTGLDKRVEKLRINDPERFWESSKVLIISGK